MIKFGKNDKVENLGILEKEEAEAYVDFLAREKLRHEADIASAQGIVDIETLWRPAVSKYNEALRQFYESAIRRHRKDIVEIDALISTVKGFYGI